MLFIVWFVHRRGNKKIAKEVEKRRQARNHSGLSGEDGHELQDRGHREPLPIYREEGGSISTGGPENGDALGQKLPEYQNAHVVYK